MFRGPWTSTPARPLPLVRNNSSAAAASGTVDTVPEPTLVALSTDYEHISVMATDSREARAVTQACSDAGIDLAGIAAGLQHDGVQAFCASWTALLQGIGTRRRDAVALVANS